MVFAKIKDWQSQSIYVQKLIPWSLWQFLFHFHCCLDEAWNLECLNVLALYHITSKELVIRVYICISFSVDLQLSWLILITKICSDGGTNIESFPNLSHSVSVCKSGTSLIHQIGRELVPVIECWIYSTIISHCCHENVTDINYDLLWSLGTKAPLQLLCGSK